MRAALSAAAPLLAALAAVLLVALAGLSVRDLAGGPLEDRFHGFFLDRYPLFAFALVYGTARIVSAWHHGRHGLLRLAGAAAGVALLLLLGLHPTFGGLVLRAGFATSGTGFLTGQSSGAARALGTAAAGAVFGAALGAGALLAAGRRRGAGWRWALARAAASFLALWWAMAALAAARGAGLEAWPRAPLDAREAGLAAALVLVAFLPHAALLLVDRRRPSG